MNKSISELVEQDKELEKEINEFAEKAGLKNDSVWPVTDGIFSAESWLNSPLKVMWILKESYDDFVDGKPAGGGWSIPKDGFNNPLKFASSSRTMKTLTYTSYGILNNKKWDEIHWLEDEPAVADCLKQIAYINLSKIPADTTTSMAGLGKKFEIWKPIVIKQIAVYNPDVLIFGNTFQFLEKDLFKGKEIPHKDYDGFYAYNFEGKLYIWAFHPGARMKQEKYVNTIVQIVNDWKHGKL